MLDYWELGEILENVSAEVCAAGCHGFLCGQICVSGFPPEELWQEFIDVQINDDEMVDDCYREIKILLADIIDNIQSPNLDFQLMLPDSESPLEDRVNALAEWCHGFLYGYGSSTNHTVSSLTEECREVLEDFARICRVGLDNETNEEDEKAFVELIEYVRMGTIMIYDDLVSESYPEDRPEFLH